MEKNYNYERKKLLLPEYGRHIHEMIDYLSTIEDRDLRNRQARAVIAVMANINPMLRDSTDFYHKLWDHLFIMSDFKLDVDSPYPIPTSAQLYPVPEKLPYPAKQIARKQYGKIVQRMIRSLESMKDHPDFEETIGNIARYMRTKSYEYNQEHPNNENIIKEIKNMSENGIDVDEVALNNLKSDYKQHFSARPQKGNYPNRNGKNKNNKKNNGRQRYMRPKQQ